MPGATGRILPTPATPERLYIDGLYMEFLQGTLDMLVLRTLAAGPMHGYGIAQAIRQSTENAIAPEAGSLYPSLQRLELQGLLTAQWETGKGKRRMRVYRLTPDGRKRLHVEVSQWEEFVRSVGRVLYPVARPSGSQE